MQRDRRNNLIHLHFIVFIWGFTAILGKLISIDSMPLVWYRMAIAWLVIYGYLKVKKRNLKVDRKSLYWLIGAGIVVALHWVTFFLAIKIATVSVALAMMSTGAFFTAILEPFVFKRKIVLYEVILGLVVVAGLYLIFQVQANHMFGIAIALVSAFLSAVFSLINSKLVKTHLPSVISLYELGIGTLFLSIILLFRGSFTSEFFNLSSEDWFYLLLLAVICTAYAFIASVKVMRVLTPYTVMLTTNLEPVYGIILAWLLFGAKEQMDLLFYIGGIIILATVVADGYLKHRYSIKDKRT